MNTTGKKLISLFLVFSLMMLSVNLYAKERRGAKLEIWGKGDRFIEGELITVKLNSLLLLDIEGKDVSIDVADVEIMRIGKKSKILLGFGIGTLTGFIVGAAASPRGLNNLGQAYLTLALFTFAGAFAGVVSGVNSGKNEIIQIEGMTDSEIQETLDYLRKKARIRNYK